MDPSTRESVAPLVRAALVLVALVCLAVVALLVPNSWTDPARHWIGVTDFHWERWRGPLLTAAVLGVAAWYLWRRPRGFPGSRHRLPEGVSPAQLAALLERDDEFSPLFSVLIDLERKGVVRIEAAGPGYFELMKVKGADWSQLGHDERRLLQNAFANAESLVLGDQPSWELAEVRGELHTRRSEWAEARSRSSARAMGWLAGCGMLANGAGLAFPEARGVEAAIMIGQPFFVCWSGLLLLVYLILMVGEITEVGYGRFGPRRKVKPGLDALWTKFQILVVWIIVAAVGAGMGMFLAAQLSGWYVLVSLGWSVLILAAFAHPGRRMRDWQLYNQSKAYAAWLKSKWAVGTLDDAHLGSALALGLHKQVPGVPLTRTAESGNEGLRELQELGQAFERTAADPPIRDGEGLSSRRPQLVPTLDPGRFEDLFTPVELRGKKPKKPVQRLVAEGALDIDFDCRVPVGDGESVLKVWQSNDRVRIEEQVRSFTKEVGKGGQVGCLAVAGLVALVAGASLVAILTGVIEVTANEPAEPGHLNGKPAALVVASAFLMAGLIGLLLPLPPKLVCKTLTVSPRGVTTYYRTPFGKWFRKRIAAHDVLDLRIAPRRKWGPFGDSSGSFITVHIDGAHKTLTFGGMLSPQDREWVRDCVLAFLYRKST